MITIKRVDSKHVLQMDSSTDKMHFVHIESKKSLLTFCKDLICRNENNERIARIKLVNNQWIVETELNIETEPANFNSDALFSLEASFCQKWLSLQ
jgi:hypothetical protein